MGLPFEPQSIDDLRARYHLALQHLYPLSRLFEDRDDHTRPGLDRAHVFDFEDGVRLLISRHIDDGPDRTELIHVSGSWSCLGEDGQLRSHGPEDRKEVWDLVDHFLALSDRRGHEIEPIGMSMGKRVAHFAVRITNTNGSKSEMGISGSSGSVYVH